MGREVTVELVIAPAAHEVADDLGAAEGWSDYEHALRAVLAEVLGTAGPLTVGRLIVNEPLPERYAGLRPGARVEMSDALDLAVGMVVGDGPYCTLQDAGGFELASGWNGAMHLLLPAERGFRLSSRQEAVLRLEWRDPPTVDPEDTPLITAVADDAFWAEVAATASAALPEPTLLAERWAYGRLGFRWFIVTPTTTQDLARTVEARSLLSVIVAPDRDPSPDELEDGFEEAIVGELLLQIPDEAMTQWHAVVPDADGVVRGRWEDERA